MKKNNYSRYFRFLKNDTVVNEITTNDFKRFKAKLPIAPTDSLVIKDPLYYGFLSRTRAMEMAKAGALEYMEMAKAGALEYMETLMDKGREGMAELLKYRNDHYEDLNETLTYANIEAIKNQNTLS